jgi:hypothetical protein
MRRTRSACAAVAAALAAAEGAVAAGAGAEVGAGAAAAAAVERAAAATAASRSGRQLMQEQVVAAASNGTKPVQAGCAVRLGLARTAATGWRRWSVCVVACVSWYCGWS